eukprot:CAMPEP_0184482688 /NCGR_PEP_ID=MMETSP0113_2-20130426/4259_1 /TAXON_ID=91329 /ORGANISM="Norrisiella sphaerica, Strain BC52" /LENGTH=41 /DNA_ID= /DNA_START= /DNA_END= /DNA_ORIENTATION=
MVPPFQECVVEVQVREMLDLGEPGEGGEEVLGCDYVIEDAL